MVDLARGGPARPMQGGPLVQGGLRYKQGCGALNFFSNSGSGSGPRVFIFYGSGSGSGSRVWVLTAPAPAPAPGFVF